MKHITLLIVSYLLFLPAFGREISGIVIDASTGEALIGAMVYVKQSPEAGTTTGLDGTFRLSVKVKDPTLVCSYLGYESIELENPVSTPLTIKMSESYAELSEVVVTASVSDTEAGARMIERKSMNVVNVMSGRAMELSPDISVGNIIQKMSGVTTERNSSGEGQYAILRGMDK